MRECPRCGVRWLGDRVLFATGALGTPQHLYARVCQYVHQRGLPGCVNDVDPATVRPEHGYGGVEGLHPEVVETVELLWRQ